MNTISLKGSDCETCGVDGLTNTAFTMDFYEDVSIYEVCYLNYIFSNVQAVELELNPLHDGVHLSPVQFMKIRKHHPKPPIPRHTLSPHLCI